MGEPTEPHSTDTTVASFIRRFADPPVGEIEEFLQMGRPLSLSAGDVFEEQGEVRHRLAFIHAGVLRYHILLRNGDDVTKDFGFPGWFAISFGSAVRSTPARVAISAVSACHLTVWPFTALSNLMENPGPWQQFGKRVAETLYIRKEDREISLLVEDATERYIALQREFPMATELIPHYQLASYLGIRPQSLSRIRGKLARGRRC